MINFIYAQAAASEPGYRAYVFSSEEFRKLRNTFRSPIIVYMVRLKPVLLDLTHLLYRKTVIGRFRTRRSTSETFGGNVQEPRLKDCRN